MLNIKGEIKYIKRAGKFYLDTGKMISGIYKFDNLMNKRAFSDTEKNIVFEELFKNWGLQVLKNNRIEIEIDEELFKKDSGNFIFMPNHCSNIDVLVLLASSPKPIKFIAKKSLFKIPFLGKAMKYTGMFKLDRNNHDSSVNTLKEISSKLKINNNSVVNFPEGTRSNNSKLQKFKKGGFHLAIDSQIPIVPVTILNTGKINSIGDWRLKDGDIKIIYHKPIATKGLNKDDILKLMKKTELIIKKTIENNS